MACEVRSRLCNGQGNLARSVRTAHSPSPSLLPSLYLSVSSTFPWLADIFSASFIYALFHQYGVLLAKCQVKLSLKIRDEMTLSLSHSLLSPFFSCLRIFPIPSRDDLCSHYMQKLTNGWEISWLERMEKLAENESMARLKLTLSRIPFYTTFPLHLVRIIHFRNGTQYVLFTIREAQQCEMSIFCMKCIPISNSIKLLPGTLFLYFMWLWGGDKEMEGGIHPLLQHKTQVISWKLTHIGVWYMASPLPCNGNLSVLYDFIQNPSSLCGVTKHIKQKWRMVPASVWKAGGG